MHSAQFQAAYRFRAARLAAIERYHDSVRMTWRAMGKPTTSDYCVRILRTHWEQFLADIRAATWAMDDALIMANYNKAWKACLPGNNVRARS